ncbi:hypothetical protein [Amycolatopsis albispora]|uniref:hypothetical protein n=1 Tax=Amycolatopsis albispora TaxID=1804986 RepID=UPI0013B40D70|nr:hypothetical protein [Amycolatopsis albispora]
MRKNMSAFAAATASVLAMGCLLVAGAGSGAATDDPPPPPVTTTNPPPDPDGNPWHD